MPSLHAPTYALSEPCVKIKTPIPPQECVLYQMPQERAWKSYEYGNADVDLHLLYTIE